MDAIARGLWNDLAEHLPLVIERAGFVQVGFLTGCLLILTGLAPRRRDRPLGLVATLGWSSVYLLVASQGEHPLQGYWCYPAACFALAAHWCVARGLQWFRKRLGDRLAPAVAVGRLVAALFLPGSGLRTTWARIRRRNEVAP